MKRLSILGSTGSIGTQALDLVDSFGDRFSVVSLLAGRNVPLMAEQVKKYRPEVAAVAGEAEAAELERLCAGTGVTVLHGEEGVRAVAAGVSSDIVLSAVSGFAGFIPTLHAVRAGRPVAIANKESLVAGGALIMREALRCGTTLLPVDSEHSAIFQSMLGHSRGDIRRLFLTASGGPFAGASAGALVNVSPEDALNHPRWRMGPKVTVDSATMMNKGFEVIEASWLFAVPADMIEILIHRQSVIHSMVEYADGSVVAQMGIADMRIPIAYALSYPERLPLPLPSLDLCGQGALTFERPDPSVFPAYTLAYQAMRTGGTATAVLCAADDVAVAAFLAGRLPFNAIAPLIRDVLDVHQAVEALEEAAVLEAAEWARRKAGELVSRFGGKGER